MLVSNEYQEIQTNLKSSNLTAKRSNFFFPEQITLPTVLFPNFEQKKPRCTPLNHITAGEITTSLPKTNDLLFLSVNTANLNS